MTTVTIERGLLEQALDALTHKSIWFSPSRRQRRMAAVEALRAALSAPATAPESGVMTEIDYNDDDALRFVQRVLESDAPLSDIRDARNMVVEIRTRVLKARASKPATAPAQPERKPMMDQTAHDMNLVAEKYAHKLALDLECVLADYSGTWYETAMKTLGDYRSAMNAIHERESPTFMGEPLILKDTP